MGALTREVVTLVNSQRWAALGSLTADGPRVSMVAYVVEPGLRGLLIFVSLLAAHTRALMEDPRYSLAISTPDDGRGDPQLLPRVSLSGPATILKRENPQYSDAADRYVAQFPDAEIRFSLGDFVMIRLEIDMARYIGGFARATSVEGDELRETARAMSVASHSS